CLEISVARDAPHALAAPASKRLDENRISDFISLLLEKFRFLSVAVIARNNRNAGLFHQGFCAVLQPHGANCCRGRSDKGYATGLTSFRELSVFRQEAVTGVKTIGACVFGNGNELFGRKITFYRRGRTD